LLFTFLTQELGLEPSLIAEALWRDYQRGGRRDFPAFLRNYLPEAILPLKAARASGPKRQVRHLAGQA
jgi:hypothetical protein